MMPEKDRNTGPLDMFIAVSLAVVVAAMACTCLIRIANDTAPRTGDIIAFDAAKRDPATVGVQVEAPRAADTSGVACLLDARTMLQSGGSLVVEATTHPKRGLEYLVHWAGVRTSDGARDCGASADLLLGRGDLGAIAVAAGGFLPAASGAEPAAD